MTRQSGRQRGPPPVRVSPLAPTAHRLPAHQLVVLYPMAPTPLHGPASPGACPPRRTPVGGRVREHDVGVAHTRHHIGTIPASAGESPCSSASGSPTLIWTPSPPGVARLHDRATAGQAKTSTGEPDDSLEAPAKTHAHAQALACACLPPPPGPDPAAPSPHTPPHPESFRPRMTACEFASVDALLAGAHLSSTYPGQSVPHVAGTRRGISLLVTLESSDKSSPSNCEKGMPICALGMGTGGQLRREQSAPVATLAGAPTQRTPALWEESERGCDACAALRSTVLRRRHRGSQYERRAGRRRRAMDRVRSAPVISEAPTISPARGGHLDTHGQGQGQAHTDDTAVWHGTSAGSIPTTAAATGSLERIIAMQCSSHQGAPSFIDVGLDERVRNATEQGMEQVPRVVRRALGLFFSLPSQQHRPHESMGRPLRKRASLGSGADDELGREPNDDSDCTPMSKRHRGMSLSDPAQAAVPLSSDADAEGELELELDSERPERAGGNQDEEVCVNMAGLGEPSQEPVATRSVRKCFSASLPRSNTREAPSSPPSSPERHALQVQGRWTADGRRKVELLFARWNIATSAPPSWEQERTGSHHNHALGADGGDRGEQEQAAAAVALLGLGRA